jgi:hypothetical protein
MGRIEKTVFVSYRRTDESWALAVFGDLTHHGYDVFVDYDGIASGHFGTVIFENIRARAHFLVLLTPTALERCGDPKDWMRREIEAALDNRRNIVPVMLEGFKFGTPAIASQLIGKLAALKEYNGLEVPGGYFSPAMERLRNKFLSVSLDTVLHPASLSAQQAATEQKGKAARALADEHRNGENEQPRNAAQAKAARQAREEERKREEEANARRDAEEERHQREAEAQRQAEKKREGRIAVETVAEKRQQAEAGRIAVETVAEKRQRDEEERRRQEIRQAEARRIAEEERRQQEAKIKGPFEAKKRQQDEERRRQAEAQGRDVEKVMRPTPDEAAVREAQVQRPTATKTGAPQIKSRKGIMLTVAISIAVLAIVGIGSYERTRQTTPVFTEPTRQTTPVQPAEKAAHACTEAWQMRDKIAGFTLVTDSSLYTSSARERSTGTGRDPLAVRQ